MKKFPVLAASILILLFVCMPARAQDGCDDSPENPTLILAGIAAGSYGVSALRNRLAAKRLLRK